MLINFTVEHFRSFGAEQTLNMVSTPLPDHPGHCVPIPGTSKSALQLGVIYGANASGKSNLVYAMLFAQQLILGGVNLVGLVQYRFRFVKKPKPVSFEFRFLARGRVFVYGFTADPDGVREEWLDAATEAGREINVFTRTGPGIRIGRLKAFGKEGTTIGRALRALRELGVRDDQLLLNRIADLPNQNRGDLLTSAVWWFRTCLTVVQPESQFTPLVDVLDGDAEFRQFCGAFLKKAGTGIDGLNVETARIDADKLPKPILDRLQPPKGQSVSFTVGSPSMTLELDATDPTKVVRKNLAALHQVGTVGYALALQEESDGTRRCLDLLPALYHMTQESKVYVVDEIDRSLHPLLCFGFLKLFLDSYPGQCQQMIVTTHETHLLDADLLRRDEIWFVEKDSLQQSQLTSLVDFNVRDDIEIENGYLNGRFGGVPVIGDTKKLRDLIQGTANGTRHGTKTPA